MKNAAAVIGAFVTVLRRNGGLGANLSREPVRFRGRLSPAAATTSSPRLVGAKMQENWASPVVIDNKPGANSIIARKSSRRAPPTATPCSSTATGGMWSTR